MLIDYFYIYKALLFSNVGFEESNRSGVVPNWHLTPVLRLSHGQRPRPK